MRLPVTLNVEPSATLAGALMFAHGAAAIGVALTGLSLGLALPVTMMLAISLGAALWRYFFRLPILALILKADGRLEIQGRDGSCAEAQIDPQTTVFPWLVALLLRIGSRNIALALFPDAMGKEAHRQLRLWLRWRASVAGA